VSLSEQTRSTTTIIQSHIDIKRWLERLPTVDEVRPARCPKCGAPSCPVGAPIVIHGHGLRDRQVRGPSAPDAPPAMIDISVRRYFCTACKTVPVVVPCEVRARRLYSASAIGLGLALWGIMKMSAMAVRKRVNPAKIFGDSIFGWATLRRWAKDVAAEKLFVDLPRAPPGSKLKHVAAAAATALAGFADAQTRVCPLEHRAFVGAAHVT
jgi:transposase